MKKRGLMLLLIIALMSPFLTTTQAQNDLTDEEIELINYISDAVNKLVTMESVYVEGTQVIEQDIRAEGQTLLQTVSQYLSGWVINTDFETSAMDMVSIQTVESSSTPGQQVEVELSMDMRLVDDELYVRVYDLLPELAPYYPADWINFEEAAADYAGFQLINPDQLTNIAANTGMTNIYNENVVLGIEELSGQILENGTELRIFEIDIDPIALLEDDSTESMLAAFNFESLGVEMDTLLEDMFNNAVYSVTVWVDTSTDIAYQVDVVVTIDAELTVMDTPVDLVQEMTASFNYSRFNEEVEITVPDLSDT